MASEFTPWWSTVKMTKAQVRQYVKDLKKAQEEAQKRLDAAKASWEFDKEQDEIDALEQKLNNL